MIEKSENISLTDYQIANRKIKMDQAKKGFKVHLTAYILVNTLLIAVNLLLVPAFYWFVFPLIGWGIGVTMHYTFGVRRFEAQLKVEEARIEHMAKR
jgi:hypothetical protein